MDAARKESRRGIAIVTAVLVVVCVWWLLFLPRTELYKNYKQKADLEKTLRAVRPPDGAAVLGINTTSVGSASWAMGNYVTSSGFDTVRSHYMQEFPRHGFVYQRQEASKESQDGLRFCAPGYKAHLLFIGEQGWVHTYTIVLIRKDGPCELRASQ
jgi:hypothetical protein